MTAANVSGRTAQLWLDGDSLTWQQIQEVLNADSVDVRLSLRARHAMTDNRDGAVQALRDGATVYGWNRGLGPLKDRDLSPNEQRQFQAHVLRSHAAGTGPELPAPVARLALVLRANSMARATMGVRPELVERMLAMVNAGITPVMPAIGSLGTGDLQPMAAGGLSLAGTDNPVMVNGQKRTASTAFAQAGLPAEFTFQSGEALPFVSGGSVLTARYANSVERAEQQVSTFHAASALFLEGTRAEAGAFDPRTHAERRLPEEVDAAGTVRELVCGTEWMSDQGRARLDETSDRVQDSTAVRAMPQVVGALSRTLNQAHNKIEREANASTSNPLVFPGKDGDGYEFVSGGNWSASEIGHAIDTLNSQVVDLAVLSENLSGRLIDPKWSYGLPTNLAGGQAGLNTGMVPMESTAAALLPEMQVRTTPASSLSRPLKGGQEDHNTMAMAASRNLDSNLRRLDTVLAVQLITGAQAIDLIREQMSGLQLGSGTTDVHAAVRKVVAPLEEDRHMSPDLRAAEDLVRGDDIAQLVSRELQTAANKCAA